MMVLAQIYFNVQWDFQVSHHLVVVGKVTMLVHT
jgi:hypothetical protein